MSESTDIKCECVHCQGGIAIDEKQFIASFENKTKIWGQEITCPHCQRTTRLYKTNTNHPDASKKTDYPDTIERKLEIIGKCFFVGGIIVGILAAIGILVAATSDHSSDEQVPIPELIAVAIVSIAQGIIIQTLFRAAAEVIRLLRKLVAKT
jgi:hypothetical protein